jgi:predicted GNAT family N-acyltransferase
MSNISQEDTMSGEEWKTIIGEEEAAKYTDKQLYPVVVHYPKGGSPDVLGKLATDAEARATVANIFYRICSRRKIVVYEYDTEDEDDDYDGGAIGQITKDIAIQQRYIHAALTAVNHLFVVYEGPGPKIAAFALVNTQNQPKPTTSYLSLMCSAASTTGKGYARRLLTAAETVVKKEGKTSMMLMTESAGLVNVYRNFGFKIVGQPKRDEYIMEKTFLSYKQALTGATRRKHRNRKTRRKSVRV